VVTRTVVERFFSRRQGRLERHDMKRRAGAVMRAKIVAI
jgi:hypothetical protein